MTKDFRSQGQQRNASHPGESSTLSREDHAAIAIFCAFAPQVVNLERLVTDDGTMIESKAIRGMARSARAIAAVLLSGEA